MGELLDYETAPRGVQPSFSGLTWAVLVSVFMHLLVFGFYAATLDGGRLARMCAAVSVGYWAVVVLIVARRRHRLTGTDLAFVAIGYPVILFPSIYIVTGGL